MESILTSIKKLLGISEEYTQFDSDLVMHINSVFLVLNQLGVGPKQPFFIYDKENTWTDFLGGETNVELVKSYVYLKVKLLFDPPLSSALIESTNRMIAEFEWRLNVMVDPGDTNTQAGNTAKLGEARLGTMQLGRSLEEQIIAMAAELAYSTQNFEDGQILTAEMLNHIEAGIVQNENSIKNLELTPGPQGKPGPQGPSAYETALENGFEGSKEEWLESLKGDDGFSPVAQVEQTSDGAVISIIDKNGETRATIPGGKKGAPGNGIESVILNPDYTLTLTFTDGQSYTTPSLRGADGEDANASIDLGEFDDPYAEMDNLIEDGHYRLSDGEFVYSLHVERLSETYLGQTYWTQEEGRTQFYCRSGFFNENEDAWEFDSWDVLATYSALSLYAPKNHTHLSKLNISDWEGWINVFREGQHQMSIQSQGKCYIVDQFAFNNRGQATNTIHVCQRYFEVSEPWKIYTRHGTTSGNYVLVSWDEWHETT